MAERVGFDRLLRLRLADFSLRRLRLCRSNRLALSAKNDSQNRFLNAETLAGSNPFYKTKLYK